MSLSLEQTNVLNCLLKNTYFMKLWDFCEQNANNYHYAVVFELKASPSTYLITDINWIKLTVPLRSVEIGAYNNDRQKKWPLDLEPDTSSLAPLINELKQSSEDKKQCLELLNPQVAQTLAFGRPVDAEQFKTSNWNWNVKGTLKQVLGTIDYLFESQAIKYIHTYQEKEKLEALAPISQNSEKSVESKNKINKV